MQSKLDVSRFTCAPKLEMPARALFCLTAMLAVSADRLLKIGLRSFDALTAFVVPVPGLAWHGAAQQEERGKRYRQNSVLLCHKPSSGGVVEFYIQSWLAPRTLIGKGPTWR